MHAASLKESDVSPDCFAFQGAVFQTPKSSLTVLEVSMEDQCG